MRRLALAAALLLTASPLAAAPVDEVVAAERAFAELSQSEPIKTTFAHFAAAHGVALQRSAVLGAHDFIASWPDADSAGSLQWRPAFAGAAASGDLGFTTGPYETSGGGHGTYLTVWQRQPDGEWRWLIDHGAPASRTPGAGGDVALLAVAALPAMDRGEALRTLVRADATLDAGLAQGWQGLAGLLARDARLMGFEATTAIGHAAGEAALAARPASVFARHEGGGVSEAGDLGWTYGYAHWQEDTGQDGEATRRAGYLRIWQRTPGGWRVVVDNFAPFP
jgi:ketosteroid isomerase-like protein